MLSVEQKRTYTAYIHLSILISSRKTVTLLEDDYLDLEERFILQELILSSELNKILGELVDNYVDPSLEDALSIQIPQIISFEFSKYRFTTHLSNLDTEQLLYRVHEEYLRDSQDELERRCQHH